MAKPHITIDFAVDGSAKVEAHNFTGSSCTEATAYLEKALGMGQGQRKRKAEFYKQNRRAVVHQQLGGGS